MDLATYQQNQTTALTQIIKTGADQPTSLTIGPSWFESFQQFPEGTEYIYGLNFHAENEARVEHAVAAYEALGERLYAFEVGNEVDGKIYPPPYFPSSAGGVEEFDD